MKAEIYNKNAGLNTVDRLRIVMYNGGRGGQGPGPPLVYSRRL